MLKKKRREGGPTCFADIVEFVEYASESANDPVFGKEALSKSKEDVKHKEKEPPSKGRIPPKKPGYPWRHKENSLATTPLGAVVPQPQTGPGLQVTTETLYVTFTVMHMIWMIVTV